jgi:hypothetical protein
LAAFKRYEIDEHGTPNRSIARCWVYQTPRSDGIGVEPAGVHDAGAGPDGRLVVRVDHRPHPLRLAGQVAVVGAGPGDRRDER